MMKKPATLRPRAALFIGAALLSTPAFAQDAPQSVTPPPIAAAPAPARPQIQVAPSVPIVQAVPEAPAAAPAAAEPRAARAAAPRQARAATPARAAAPARIQAQPAAAPAAQPAPVVAPVTEAPGPASPAVEPAAAPVAATPAPVAETAATVQQTTTSRVAWPWMLGALALVLGGIAALLVSRRRREEDLTPAQTYYAEPVSEPVIAQAQPEYTAVTAYEPVAEPEPQPAFVAAPIAAILAEPEPVTAHVEEAVAHPTDARDLEGVADAPAPVASRPWLEFGMRPVRAGTNDEDALVEFELTVGNSGDTAARDVHVTTFMLPDGAPEEMERLLTEHRGDDTVAPMTIAPGEGTRIDATVAASKEGLGRVFNPIMVAEARYTMPGGKEGRTSAAFRIGRPAAEGGIGPIGSNRAHMVENVEAELYGVPEHA